MLLGLKQGNGLNKPTHAQPNNRGQLLRKPHTLPLDQQYLFAPPLLPTALQLEPSPPIHHSQQVVL